MSETFFYRHNSGVLRDSALHGNLYGSGG